MNKSKYIYTVITLFIIAVCGYFFWNKYQNSLSSQQEETNLPQYTMAEVEAHNKETDCWTTVHGGVYNVTSWISLHPGGKAAIIATCGIDATPLFKDQHEGQKEPEEELASLKIGILK
jgi:cytochrome b involved in lipid metabolism